MVSRKGLVCAAACAAMTIAGVARAEEASIASPALPAVTCDPADPALGTDADAAPPQLGRRIWTTAHHHRAAPADRRPGRPAASQPPRRTPLMSVFDAVGIGKTLDDLHIAIYGHVEGSYTYHA